MISHDPVKSNRNVWQQQIAQFLLLWQVGSFFLYRNQQMTVFSKVFYTLILKQALCRDKIRAHFSLFGEFLWVESSHFNRNPSDFTTVRFYHADFFKTFLPVKYYRNVANVATSLLFIAL